MSQLGLPELIVVLLAAAIMVPPFWTIFGKAGFPRALALLMFIPGVNLLVLYYVAFSRWNR